jgi:hypothetical protein
MSGEVNRRRLAGRRRDTCGKIHERQRAISSCKVARAARDRRRLALAYAPRRLSLSSFRERAKKPRIKML